MPNWCSNVLVVEGSGADAFLSDLRSKANDEGVVENFFDAFDPMPQAFAGVSLGSVLIDDRRYRAWRTVTKDDGTTEDVPVDEDVLAAWRSEYGFDNWYDWSIANWGTKWDVNVSVRDLPMMRFETAWSPPERFLATLSEKYPTVDFRLVYAECGMGYAGEVVFRDGGPLSHSEFEGSFWPDDLPEDADPMENLVPPVQHLVDKYGVGTGG